MKCVALKGVSRDVVLSGSGFELKLNDGWEGGVERGMTD